MIKQKTLDIAFLLFLPLLATIVTFYIRPSFLVSTLLFYGLPSLYLALRTTNRFLHVVIFSLILSTSGVMIGYFATKDLSWLVPNPTFLYRVFGGVTVDELIWGFLFVFSAVMFFEHFLDRGKHRLVDSKMKYLLYLLLILFLGFFLGLFFFGSSLKIDYFYLKGSLLTAVFPIVAILFRRPKLIGKFLVVVGYFTLLSVLHEISALSLNQWTFPGNNFIGWVEFGGIRFPFEEFFFYIILGSIGVISWYEYFDDEKIKIRHMKR